MELVAFHQHPVSLDGLAALPEDLDGSQGSNRLPQAYCQIQASDDWKAIQCWLTEFDDSPHTRRKYCTEAERLLLWSIRQQRKPISGLLREDFQAYQRFLANPLQRITGVDPKRHVTRPRGSPSWDR